MKRLNIVAGTLLMAALTEYGSTASAAEPHVNIAPAGAPVVFFDIAGPDSKALGLFYSNIFGWNIQSDGRFTTSVMSPLPGTLRQEVSEDARFEKLMYLGVPDITATLAKITASGGSVVYPRFEVPGVVILGLFKDPAGNRMGLVELENGKPKVPKAKASQ